MSLTDDTSTDETSIDRDPTAPPLLRPQPIGVLDGTAGLLLVPSGDGVAECLTEIARLGVAADWPDAAATPVSYTHLTLPTNA